MTESDTLENDTADKNDEAEAEVNITMQPQNASTYYDIKTLQKTSASVARMVSAS